jgi:hypothetical protein
VNRILVVALLAASAATAQTVSYVGRQNYPLATAAFRTRIADFNGDGRPDVAMLLGTTVSVALHDDASWYLPALSFAPVGRPTEMATGDLNKDGKLDLVLAGDAQGNFGSIQIFKGNGDGTFTAGVTIPNPFTAPPAGLLVGDLNGDGAPDIIGLTSAGVMLLCSGAGDGTFGTTIWSLVFPPAAGGRPVLADFNGDHNLDLGYTTEGAANRMIIMRGRGDYSLMGPLEFAMPQNSNGALWLATDVTEDGRADVIVFMAATSLVYVFPAAPDGSLMGGPGTSVANGGSGGLADLDGDGHVDLVTVSSSATRVLLGRGDGTFGTVKSYEAGMAPVEVLFGDANGDSKPDLFIPGAGFTVMRNDGSGSLVLESRSNMEVSVLNGLMSLETGDYNADGKNDLLAIGWREGMAPTVGVMLGFGMTTSPFLAQPVFEAASANSPQSVNWVQADFNGDGRPDLVFGGSTEVRKYLGEGQGKFGAPAVTSGDFSGSRLIAKDFNGDGRVDLLMAGGGIRLALANSSGGFLAPVLVDVGVLLEAGDLNADGRPDLLVQQSTVPGQQVWLLLNKGTGTFDTAILTTLPKVYQSFGLADLNGDGKPDLVARIEKDSAAGPAAVMLGAGSWNFGAPLEFETADVEAAAAHFSARFLDVNADGKLDMVTGALGAGVKVRLGKGDGTFRPVIRYVADTGGANLQAADLDGDGKPDIAVAGAGTAVSLLYQQTHALPVLLSAQMTHQGAAFRAPADAYFTVQLSNLSGGNGALSPAIVTAAVDPGLTLVSMSGSGWSCGGGGSTCTRAEDLASGASYPVITVRVQVGDTAATPAAVRVSYTVGGVGGAVADSIEVLPAGTAVFADVALTNGFAGAIEQMRALHITDGCAAAPLRYCPEAAVTRGQMGVFVVRAMMGGDSFAYPAAPYFEDVPAGHQFFKWIQKMKELGITDGCAVGRYCPDSIVTRGQMGVFVVRARYGAAATFQYPAEPLFTDVPATHSFYRWIQKMRQVGITLGCAEGLYCPDDVVTRGQMAVFVMRGLFNLLLDPSTPMIVASWPAVVAPGQVTSLTVTGRNTHFVAGTTTITAGAGVTLGEIQVVNATTITMKASIAAGAAGARSIVAVTGSEEAVLPNGLRIQ